jgi:two-component system NarL family sensor kinase
MVTAPADRVAASTPATRSAAALAVAAVVEVLLWLILSLAHGRTFDYLLIGHELNAAVVALAFGIAGFVVLRSAPHHPLGWLFAVIAQLEGIALVATAYADGGAGLPGAGVAAWIGAVLWWPGAVAGAALLTPLFPDGATTRLRRVLLWIGSIAAALSTLFIAVTDTPYPANPLALPEPWNARSAIAALVCALVGLACGLVGAVLLAIAMWRASGAERRRLAWFFAAFGVVVLVTTLPVGPVVQLAGTAFLPFGLGMAILRHGLFDGDRLLNRTLVYGALSMLVAATFGLGVGLLSSAVGGPTAGAVVAAVVIAIGLTPARERVQRGVDRLLYGQRRDPYTALIELGRQVSGAVAPDQILAIVCRAVATTLRLPYAAITLGADRVPAAAHGEPMGDVTDIPLLYAGTPVGRLEIDAARRRQFDAEEERLLEAFGKEAATAANTVRLSRELRQSHERLVSARDSERHRIRRDLHDQLAPALAGVALGIGAARRAVAPHDPQTGDLLEQLRTEVRDSLEDVKLLIGDLRPTILERDGLIDALRRHAATVSGDRLEVRVDAEPLPVLPSPVEVAAYRIALEAVANTSRHSGATACRISLRVAGDTLTVSVSDNGVGLPPVRQSLGLGLSSMAERAAALGGRCVVGAAAPRGTLVEATLPLGRAA